MDLSKLRQLNEQKNADAIGQKRHAELLLDNTNTQEVIVKSFAKLVEYLDRKVTKTEVVNQLREIGTPDVENVVTALASLHDTLKKHKNVDLSQVTSVMQGVLEEVKQIPKENPKLPEQKFVDYSKQLVQLEKSLQSVEKAIKAQELKVDAPVVNVPETVINVDKPDLAPIEKSISTSSKDVVKAVKGIKMPEFKTKSIEDLLKKTNKLLDGLPELMPSGGGGGGSSWPAINSAGTPLPLNLDADGKLITTSTGGGAGTEYTEGDTDASFTGGMALVEGAANTAVTLKQPTQPTDTQPVSAVSLPLPTGAATAANQQTDALTDTQLRATPVPVSGTVTAELSATDNTVLDNIDTATTGLNAKDLMLGTDFSAVFGANTLLTTTQADSRVNTTDAFTVNSWGQYYNGTTWDRMRGDATDGLLVNLGANNDITGTVTANLSATDNQVLDDISADTGNIDTNAGTTSDAASTAGGTGTISAKLRLMTTQLNAIDGNTNGIETLLTAIAAYVDDLETLITSTNTKLDTANTSLGTLDNAISGSEMQVDVVGALPAGTNAIGKLSANSGVDIGDVDVTSAVSGTLDHGSNLDIDTSAEQITSTSFACKFGVTLKAAATNTGTLYIGDSSSVTAGTTGSTDGFPLEPGESVTLPVNNPNLLYAIASVANQKIFWVAT